MSVKHRRNPTDSPSIVAEIPIPVPLNQKQTPYGLDAI